MIIDHERSTGCPKKKSTINWTGEGKSTSSQGGTQKRSQTDSCKFFFSPALLLWRWSLARHLETRCFFLPLSCFLGLPRNHCCPFWVGLFLQMTSMSVLFPADGKKLSEGKWGCFWWRAIQQELSRLRGHLDSDKAVLQNAKMQFWPTWRQPFMLSTLPHDVLLLSVIHNQGPSMNGTWVSSYLLYTSCQKPLIIFNLNPKRT